MLRVLRFVLLAATASSAVAKEAAPAAADPALEQGVMNATIVQDTYRIGYEAVHSLVMKLNHETPPKRLDLPGRVVTKGDLSNPELRKLLSPATTN